MRVTQRWAYSQATCLHITCTFYKIILPVFISGTKETEKETCDLECGGCMQLAYLTGSWIVLWIIPSKCHWWSGVVPHDWWSVGIRSWDRWGTSQLVMNTRSLALYVIFKTFSKTVLCVMYLFVNHLLLLHRSFITTSLLTRVDLWQVCLKNTG